MRPGAVPQNHSQPLFAASVRQFLLLPLLLMTCIAVAAPLASDGRPLIGVLNHQGDAFAEQPGTPTADDLTQASPDHGLPIIPIRFDAIESTTSAGQTGESLNGNRAGNRAGNQAPFTLHDALSRYWIAVLTGIAALLVLLVLVSRVLHLNQRLSRANTRLERRQQLILDSVAEGIYGVDLQGRATFVNKAMERMTGWRSEEMIGNDEHEIIHHTRADGEPHSRDDCPVYTTFRDSQPRFVDDDLFWRRDGSSFPVEYSVTPIRDERGVTIGSVVVFRDITDRRKAAERISRHEAEQAHFSRMSTLGEMASGIAHELNQPLTAITTNARACVRMIESDRATMASCSNVMTKIAEQAERAGEVIRQIRRFIRKEQPEISATAVDEIFETVMVLLREEARRTGVILYRQIGLGADRVMAQRTQIEQVLLNLARNAIEAMSDQQRERRVLLLARRDGDKVEIRVVDTGPGLGKGSPEHLFEPFVTTKAQGLGVGLSISNGIVEAHGGRLRVDSTAGIGATFYFSLECASEDQDQDPAQHQHQNQNQAPEIAAQQPRPGL